MIAGIAPTLFVASGVMMTLAAIAATSALLTENHCLCRARTAGESEHDIQVAARLWTGTGFWIVLGFGLHTAAWISLAVRTVAGS